MQLHIGSGGRELPGFMSLDIRKGVGAQVIGHMGAIPLADGAVTLMFGHAILEHLYLAQQLPTLREWRRVLQPSGLLVILGIPDFRAIAQAYLSGEPGVLSETFELFEVYRFTHGWPENRTLDRWDRWDPAKRGRTTPEGWLPQLHKALFEASYVHELLDAAQFANRVVFSYQYPGEPQRVNLGLVASPEGSATLADLSRIPDVGEYLNVASAKEVGAKTVAPSRLLREAARLAAEPTLSRRLRMNVRRLEMRSPAISFFLSALRRRLRDD